MASATASWTEGAEDAEQQLLPDFLVGGQPFLDTTPLRDLSRRTFFQALAAATPDSSTDSSSQSNAGKAGATPGGGSTTPKTVILDPVLAGPLGLTIDVASLKAHGVDKMFWLELDQDPTEYDEDQGERQEDTFSSLGATRWPPKRLRVPVNAPTRAVVYICRPEIACMRVIAGHILADLAANNSHANMRPGGPLPSSSSLSHTYSVLLSPRRTELSLLYLASLRLLPAPTPIDPSSSTSAQLNYASASGLSSATSSSSYLTTVLDLPLEFLPLDGTASSAPSSSTAQSQTATAAKPSPSTASSAFTSSSLLSLEWTHEFAFTRLYRDGDHAAMYLAAQALMTVQHVYGLIPRIVGKGDLAKRLADLLIRQRREHLSADPTNPALVAPPTFMPMAPPSQPSSSGAGPNQGSDPASFGRRAGAGWSNPNRIDALIIIDRSVDWASVLCTQLTYEGLIKEVIGIRNAHVDVDASLVGGQAGAAGPSGQPGDPARSPAPGSRQSPNPASSSSNNPGGPKRKYLLSTLSDPVYARLRDLNFSSVGERLHAMATRLNASYADRHSAKTMAEIKAFVGRLGSLQATHQALGVHTDLTERITRRTSGDEVFHRMLEIQQNIVAGLDLSGQLNAIEDLIYASTSGPGGLLAGTTTRDGQPIAPAQAGQPSTASLLPILRLLCLMSVVSGGLKAKNLEYIKRELCQTFGYDVLPLLLQLSKVGLLTREGAGPGVGFSSSAATLDRAVANGGGGDASNAATGGTGPSGLPSSLSATGATAYSGFSAVRRTLKLINDDVDERNPKDVSYVFSGYAPLSIRLVQIVAQREALVAGATSNVDQNGQQQQQGANGTTGAYGRRGKLLPRAHPIAGWKGYEDVLSILPGATFDEVQRPVLNSRPASSTSSAPLTGGGTTKQQQQPALQPQIIDPDSPRTTLVFFLGGATYAEVSALRFMSAQTRNRRFVAMTTHMVGGDDVLGGLVDGFGR
ncbi:Vacuolar protein-sorting-associated protein 33 [Tilletia horrida]|nr:Vacuolar protein-sorting-associated protein 33 [Tilletia horrida]